MGGLIRYFQPESHVTPTEAVLYALGISLCSLFIAVFHQPMFLSLQRTGLWLRVAACAQIYRKVLVQNLLVHVCVHGVVIIKLMGNISQFRLQ